MDNSALDDIPSLLITNKGIFKYILILCEDSDGNKKRIVRGSTEF